MSKPKNSLLTSLRKLPMQTKSSGPLGPRWGYRPPKLHNLRLKAYNAHKLKLQLNSHLRDLRRIRSSLGPNAPPLSPDLQELLRQNPEQPEALPAPTPEAELPETPEPELAEPES